LPVIEYLSQDSGIQIVSINKPNSGHDEANGRELIILVERLVESFSQDPGAAFPKALLLCLKFAASAER